MSEIIVEELAGIVGTSGTELVKQLQAAGIQVNSPNDSITNDQKLTLLTHLQNNTSTETSSATKPKLSLGRNAERKNTNTTVSKKAKVTTVRHKKRAIPRGESSQSGSLNVDGLEGNRTEALAKKLEAESLARAQGNKAQPEETTSASVTSDDVSTATETETQQASSVSEAPSVVDDAVAKPVETEVAAPSDVKQAEPKAEANNTAPAASAQNTSTEAPAQNTASTNASTEDKKPAASEQQAKPAPQKAPETAPAKPAAAAPSVKAEAKQNTPKAKVEPQKTAEKTPPPASTKPQSTKSQLSVNTNTSFEDARRKRDSVAAAAREEASSLLKRRPSRKVIKPVEKPAPVAAEKPATPAAADANNARKKKALPTRTGSAPANTTANKPSGADARKNRRKNNRHKQRGGYDSRSVKIEQSTEHGFERPTAPVVHEIEIPESIVVSELAKMLSIKAPEIIKTLMKMGMMVTINQTVDQDTAILITEEMGHKATPLAPVDDESILAEVINSDQEYEAVSRPPVVTIMGHVDHGKTSLLDYIRSSRVASGEAGGITQHIGAYHVETPTGIVSFLDTPGHAAFSAMRARGAQATDVVVLVVAADDGVKPQTIEAIKHTRASGVPLVVALNKIDKEEADPERVRNELSAHDVISEDWGGDDVFVNVSAKTGEGVDNLLEALTLVAEVLELKAPVDGPATGTVVEASIEKGRGAVATVLVQKGTLRPGDMILCGTEYGRVRAMLDESGKQVDSATPSIPVSVLGLSGAPASGDEMLVVSDEKRARAIADMRRDKEREHRLSTQQAAKLEALFHNMKHGQTEVVNILLKADVQGSVEALRDSLTKMSTDEVKVNIVTAGVGGINESDASLAQASNAIIIGFNVRADATARRNISEAGLDLRYYSIIYEAIDDVRDAMSGLLSPEMREEFSGLAEVKDVFRSTAFGAAAGCLVTEGTVRKGLPIRILRENVVIFTGELESLRRHKDDVSEVRTGTECGIAVKNYNDIQPGDQIECFERTEVARTI